MIEHDPAEDFSLPDQDGKMHSLKEYHPKWVILYFYPRDDTPGCTKEACNFRDNVNQFEKLGVVILGVSKDSVESHKKFADKYKLNFPLLSDTEKTVIKTYHAWGAKKFLGQTFEGVLRTTYLIDPDGFIWKICKKVNPLVHASQIICELKKAVISGNDNSRYVLKK